MTKSILKEIFIMILLCLVIVLVLAIVFYDYVPTNKVIPMAVEYTMPEELSEVKEELDLMVANGQEEIIQTYEIEESDLNAYEKTSEAGKTNPFEKYIEEPVEETNNSVSTGNQTNTTKNTTNTSNTNSTNKKENTSSSTGVFFETPGSK